MFRGRRCLLASRGPCCVPSALSLVGWGLVSGSSRGCKCRLLTVAPPQATAHAHPLPGPLHPSSPLPWDKQPRPPVVLPPAGSSPARLAGTPHGSLLSWNLAFGNLASSAGSSIGWAYEQVAPLPMRLKITVSPLKFVGHVTKALSASLCSSSSSADGERPAAAGWMQMVLTLLLLKKGHIWET